MKRQKLASDSVSWSAYGRPALPATLTPDKGLRFMQVDIDNYSANPDRNYTNEKTSQVAVVQMFGITPEGHSVVAHVHGFMPYFYVELPPGSSRIDCAAVMANLEAALKESQGVPRGVSPLV